MPLPNVRETNGSPSLSVDPEWYVGIAAQPDHRAGNSRDDHSVKSADRDGGYTMRTRAILARPALRG